jgi:oligopeptide transport system substrate-binding protein
LKRRTVVGGLGALLASGLAACGRKRGAGAGSAETGGAGGSARHLRRHMEDSPRTLDPSLNSDIPTANVIDDLFEGLLRLDAAGTVVAAVARSWMQSPDGLTWTFELRDDARWSNGDRVTAHDFVWSWQRLVDPKTGSQSVQQVYCIAGAQAIVSGKAPPTTLGVVARGEFVLEARLQQRTPWFPYLLTNNFMMPLHRLTVEGRDDRWTRPGAMVSNGPFFLAAQRIDGPLRLERNPHHPEAASLRFDTVTYYPVADRGAVTSRYLAGDLDITNGFQVDDYEWLRARLQPGEVRLAPYFGTVMFSFHATRAPFDNRALRLAMNLAVDRERITDKLLHGLFLPAYDIVPPVPGYEPALPEWATWPAERRHERARELYAEAGFSPSRPLRVELFYAMGDPDSDRIMEALAAMWRTVLGADIQLAGEEFRVLIQNRNIGKHELFWFAWIGDYPDPLAFLELRRVGSGQNFDGFANPRFESLLNAAAASPDDATRAARYAEAEVVLNDDAINLPLYFYKSRHLLKPWVRGFADNAMDRHASRDLWKDLPPAPGSGAGD